MAYIKGFLKFFDVIEESLEKINDMVHKWVFTSDWAVKEQEYEKRREEYIHYKEKNLKLIKEIEALRKKRKEISQNKFLRLERVRFYFYIYLEY